MSVFQSLFRIASRLFFRLVTLWVSRFAHAFFTFLTLMYLHHSRTGDLMFWGNDPMMVPQELPEAIPIYPTSPTT